MYSTVEKGNKNSPTYSLYFSKYEKSRCCRFIYYPLG